jgi:hypothetical protein
MPHPFQSTAYPRETGRYFKVKNALSPEKVALMGDSTIDNGYWVQRDRDYAKRTRTVTHQVANSLDEISNEAYVIANFAVDGATTADVLEDCLLNKVLPADDDHPNQSVHQLQAISAWQPEVVVLSVAGNNYREALQGTLRRQLNISQLFFRTTPQEAKSAIKLAFDAVKVKLLRDYKAIIDGLIDQNPNLKRLVLVSQYYPELTELTAYFIYTGFSHVGRAEGKKQHVFEVVEDTMNELYRDIMAYAADKGKEIVLADATSSLNPLGGNHTHQIEPNEKGATLMGKLIANAVTYSFPKETQKPIARLSLAVDEKTVQSEVLTDELLPTLAVKKIDQFIQESRYRHLNLLFSPSSNLTIRYESAYHMLMGKQFDTEYKGLFAFGLLDASLITVLASYLWRVTVNNDLPLALRITAGIVVAPIFLAKMIVGLACMLALGLPILAYHQVAKCFSELQDKPVEIPALPALTPAPVM